MPHNLTLPVMSDEPYPFVWLAGLTPAAVSPVFSLIFWRTAVRPMIQRLPAAETLHIGHPRHRPVLGIGVASVDGAGQKLLLCTQRRSTLGGNDLEEVLEHHLQPPCHLWAGGPAKPDLSGCKSNEIFPVRRPIEKPRLSGGIPRDARAKLSPAEQMKQVIELIDG